MMLSSSADLYLYERASLVVDDEVGRTREHDGHFGRIVGYNIVLAGGLTAEGCGREVSSPERRYGVRSSKGGSPHLPLDPCLTL
jgi:hypothetical protein